jgi:DNA-binding Xre family transcriptional regulator
MRPRPAFVRVEVAGRLGRPRIGRDVQAKDLPARIVVRQAQLQLIHQGDERAAQAQQRGFLA